MRRKQKLTGHQKQLRRFTIFFVILIAMLMAALIWFLNVTLMKRH